MTFFWSRSSKGAQDVGIRHKNVKKSQETGALINQLGRDHTFRVYVQKRQLPEKHRSISRQPLHHQNLSSNAAILETNTSRSDRRKSKPFGEQILGNRVAMRNINPARNKTNFRKQVSLSRPKTTKLEQTQSDYQQTSATLVP
jgi:hypothetical protein